METPTTGMPLATLFAYAIAALITLIAAVTDVRSQRIPNWLTLPALLLAPVVYGIAFSWRGLAGSLFGLFACGLLPYMAFRKGGMAGGDVKLFAAIGAVTGVALGIEAEFYAVIVAGIFALLQLAIRGKLLRTLGSTFYVGMNPVLPKKWRRRITPEMMTRIRLGAPIFVGTMVAIGLRTPLSAWGIS